MKRIAPTVALAIVVLVRFAPTTNADVEVPALARHLPEVKFTATALGDVVDFLRDVTGANVYVQWDVLGKLGVDKGAPITYAAKDEKLSTALTDVLDAATGHKGQAVYGTVGSLIVLTTPADLKQMQATAARHAAAKEPDAITRHIPQAKFNGNGLSDVFAFLQDIAGIKVHPDWAALKAAGVEQDASVTLRVSDLPVGQVLSLVLASTGGKHPLDYRVEPNGSVTVTTAAALARH